VYEQVPRGRIIEVLTHCRELLRQVHPTNERERLETERREIIAKYFISNLRRTSEHPTLSTLREVADAFLLTAGAAHELFGYDLDSIRRYDLQWNAARTHIVESYCFDRDRVVDLPLELAPEDSFRTDAMLSELVRKWREPTPIRLLDEEVKLRPTSFYVYIGTEDCQDESLPPGSMALVESIDDAEAARPNPRSIYLLQFGNGYGCSRCVLTRGKLQMLSASRRYSRAQDFACPGDVRIVGRVRMFAHALPQPEYQLQDWTQPNRGLADLTLPWEHQTRDHLLLTKQRRFRRTKEDETAIRELLTNLFHLPLSARTERRYRYPSSSEPHVRALIQLTLFHFARYSDVLRGSGSPIIDRGRFSLAAIRSARSIEELVSQRNESLLRIPILSQQERLREFVDWLPLLSFKFPKHELRLDSVARLSHGFELEGIDSPIGAGSWMLLQPVPNLPDTTKEHDKRGWSRPLYVLRRGLRIAAGHLEREGSDLALLSREDGALRREKLRLDEFRSLQRVVGVAVPV
jgi:hypothetical protein